LGANRINYDTDFFPLLEEPEDSSHNGFFGICAYDDKLASLNFGQESLNPRFIERVNTALVKDNLSVLFEDVAGQVGVTIGRKTNVIMDNGVAHLFLAIGAVYAASCSVIAGIYIAH
jgi:hypothetical protein